MMDLISPRPGSVFARGLVDRPPENDGSFGRVIFGENELDFGIDIFGKSSSFAFSSMVIEIHSEDSWVEKTGRFFLGGVKNKRKGTYHFYPFSLNMMIKTHITTDKKNKKIERTEEKFKISFSFFHILVK